MPPVITPEARERVIRMTDEAEQAGGRIVVDGRGLVVDGHENGNFVGPIVVTDLDRDHPTYTEEVFGPVLVVMHVNNFDEALDLVNASPFGNGTAIFTDSGHYARRFQEEVTVGMIGRSEEHTSELQSRGHLVCRLLLEKKKKTNCHTPRA